MLNNDLLGKFSHRKHVILLLNRLLYFKGLDYNIKNVRTRVFGEGTDVSEKEPDSGITYLFFRCAVCGRKLHVGWIMAF